MPQSDTNGAIKNVDGELDNSFLLNDTMPKPSKDFKVHVAKAFKKMGLPMDDIRNLISMMQHNDS
jgi:hypothetical protein